MPSRSRLSADEIRDRTRMRSRALYARRAAAGQCRECGDPVVAGRKFCQRHLDIAAKQMRERRWIAKRVEAATVADDIDVTDVRHLRLLASQLRESPPSVSLNKQCAWVLERAADHLSAMAKAYTHNFEHGVDAP